MSEDIIRTSYSDIRCHGSVKILKSRTFRYTSVVHTQHFTNIISNKRKQFFLDISTIISPCRILKVFNWLKICLLCCCSNNQWYITCSPCCYSNKGRMWHYNFVDYSNGTIKHVFSGQIILICHAPVWIHIPWNCIFNFLGSK